MYPDPFLHEVETVTNDPEDRQFVTAGIPKLRSEEPVENPRMDDEIEKLNDLLSIFLETGNMDDYVRIIKESFREKALRDVTDDAVRERIEVRLKELDCVLVDTILTCENLVTEIDREHIGSNDIRDEALSRGIHDDLVHVEDGVWETMRKATLAMMATVTTMFEPFYRQIVSDELRLAEIHSNMDQDGV